MTRTRNPYDAAVLRYLAEAFGMPVEEFAHDMLLDPRATIEALAKRLGKDPDAVAAALEFGSMDGVDKMFAEANGRSQIALVCDCGERLSSSVTPGNMATLLIGHTEHCVRLSTTMTFVCVCGAQRAFGPGHVKRGRGALTKAIDADFAWLDAHAGCTAVY